MLFNLDDKGNIWRLQYEVDISLFLTLGEAFFQLRHRVMHASFFSTSVGGARLSEKCVGGHQVLHGPILVNLDIR